MLIWGLHMLNWDLSAIFAGHPHPHWSQLESNPNYWMRVHITAALPASPASTCTVCACSSYSGSHVRLRIGNGFSVRNAQLSIHCNPWINLYMAMSSDQLADPHWSTVGAGRGCTNQSASGMGASWRAVLATVLKKAQEQQSFNVLPQTTMSNINVYYIPPKIKPVSALLLSSLWRRQQACA